jgi:4-hydroxybenzoate polyprenyltransferase
LRARTLTPYAGWASTGRPLDAAHAILLLGFCPLFAALYPLTQLYQLEEDVRRGDRTFASVLGVVRSLDVSLLAAGVAFALFIAASARAGWRPQPDAWRWTLVFLAALAWALVLISWRVRARELRAEGHQLGMYRALTAWAVTDFVMLIAWGT